MFPFVCHYEGTVGRSSHHFSKSFEKPIQAIRTYSGLLIIHGVFRDWTYFKWQIQGNIYIQYIKEVLHIQAKKSSILMNCMLIHTTQYLRLSVLKYIQMKVCPQLPYMGNTWRLEACTSIRYESTCEV